MENEKEKNPEGSQCIGEDNIRMDL